MRVRESAFVFDSSSVLLPSRQSLHLCLCSQTLDKKLNSLLNHYDKIMFSCLNANSCGHVVFVSWFFDSA